MKKIVLIQCVVLSFIIFQSCSHTSSKGNGTNQDLSNIKWNSLIQYGLDSNVKTIISGYDDEEIKTQSKLDFDKYGLLRERKYTLYCSKDTMFESYYFDYKFDNDGKLTSIICTYNNNEERTKKELYFEHDIIYGDKYIIIKSKQHPTKESQRTGYCQDWDKYETFEYKANILSDGKIRFDEYEDDIDWKSFEFVMHIYDSEFFIQNNPKITYYN
jgi:hypothetical protein